MSQLFVGNTFPCCKMCFIRVQNTENVLKKCSKHVDCKTVVFFANAGDRQYANARRSGASMKTARENGERPKTTVLQSSKHAEGLLTGKVQNMGPWSIDPLGGPGPWTGSIKIWTGSMDPLFLPPHRKINKRKPHNKLRAISIR